MKRNSQQGVALVVTLILLSVITFMTVTFLALSRRERGSGRDETGGWVKPLQFRGTNFGASP